jgi:hypothetical protein
MSCRYLGAAPLGGADAGTTALQVEYPCPAAASPHSQWIAGHWLRRRQRSNRRPESLRWAANESQQSRAVRRRPETDPVRPEKVEEQGGKERGKRERKRQKETGRE